MKRLIAGCGYLGCRVASLWRDQGDEVHVLTRSLDRARDFAAAGFHPVVGDVTVLESLAELPDCDTVLNAVGFDRSAAATKRQVYVDGLSNLLRTAGSRCSRFLHVSSTSVYGQSNGEVVTEQSPCEPDSESGQICLAAERLVEQFAADPSTSACILRLSGIYGPGRLLSRVEAIRSRTPLPGQPEAWLNLIHVDDAARVIVRLASHSTLNTETAAGPCGLLLVSDCRPITRAEYYRRLADLTNAPEPVFDTTAIARHTHGHGKRCDNSRLLAVPELSLRYPSIDEGLPHAVSATDDRVG